MDAEKVPLEGMYEQADELLEPLLHQAFCERREDPANPEKRRYEETLLFLAKLNQCEGQIRNFPHRGKTERIGRLLGTDYLTIHLEITEDHIIELWALDAVERRYILKMKFIELEDPGNFVMHDLTFL